MTNDWAMAAIAFAILLTMVLCIWRLTSMIGKLLGTSTRVAERAEKQRDRFAQQVFEHVQAMNNPAMATKMAQLHAQEASAAHRVDMQRDDTEERAKGKLLREAERIAAEQNRARVDHELDAHR